MPDDDIDRLSDPFGVLGDIFGGTDEYASDPDDANAELPLPIDAEGPELTGRPDPSDDDPDETKGTPAAPTSATRHGDLPRRSPAKPGVKRSRKPQATAGSLGLFFLFLIALAAMVVAC